MRLLLWSVTPERRAVRTSGPEPPRRGLRNPAGEADNGAVSATSGEQGGERVGRTQRRGGAENPLRVVGANLQHGVGEGDEPAARAPACLTCHRHLVEAALRRTV